jgi:integrase
MSSITRTNTSTGQTRWRVRYRSPDGASREKWFDRKADAERFAAGVKADLDRGVYHDPEAGKITLGEWITQHEAARLGRRPSTIARDWSSIRTHILPVFGRRALKSIQPVEVRVWVAALVDTGRAPATVRKAHQLLSGTLEAAYQDGLLPANPARRVDLPAPDHKEMRALSPTEIDALANTVTPRYRALVLTAAYTGCRFGELAALRVGRLDLLHRTLRVEEAATEVKGELHYGPPKTKASIRAIALPKGLVDELDRHIAAYPPGPDGLVFTGVGGGPLRAANFRHRNWTPAVQASVGGPCRFHDLRHSHAAMLIASGQHPKVIQSRLGHASIKTTLDVYGHLFRGLDEAAADALDGMMNPRAVGLAWG